MITINGKEIRCANVIYGEPIKATVRRVIIQPQDEGPNQDAVIVSVYQSPNDQELLVMGNHIHVDGEHVHLIIDEVIRRNREHKSDKSNPMP